MRPGGGRAKGHAFERWVAQQFRAAMPGVEVKRGLQSRGGEVPDVVVPHFWLECKRGSPAYCNPKKALEQAKRDATDDYVPVAILKEDRKPPIVCMEFHQFMTLVQQWWSTHKPTDPAA